MTATATGERQYYGLNGLDRKLEKYLDFDNGFFFEAGANDGVNQSNTKYFEEFRGWRGLLVEPTPQKFFNCVANRPDAFVEWAALVPNGWTRPTVRMTYCNLMTITEGALGDEQTRRAHLEKGRKFIPNEKIYEYNARARTIDEILKKYGIKHIDFMSLDIEGFEIDALNGMDLSNICPTYLLIEVRDYDKISDLLSDFYTEVDQLSYHDFLYKAR